MEFHLTLSWRIRHNLWINVQTQHQVGFLAEIARGCRKGNEKLTDFDVLMRLLDWCVLMMDDGVTLWWRWWRMNKFGFVMRSLPIFCYDFVVEAQLKSGMLLLISFVSNSFRESPLLSILLYPRSICFWFWSIFCVRLLISSSIFQFFLLRNSIMDNLLWIRVVRRIEWGFSAGYQNVIADRFEILLGRLKL